MEELKLTLTDPTVPTTRSSKDLNEVEERTSPSFLDKLPPIPPKSDVDFSATPERASLVFWYLIIDDFQDEKDN